MRDYELMTELDEKPTDEELKQRRSICVICDEPIRLLCGGARIKWSGCCVGFKWEEDGDEVVCLDSRSAHISCFVQHHSDTVIEVIYEDKGGRHDD